MGEDIFAVVSDEILVESYENDNGSVFGIGKIGSVVHIRENECTGIGGLNIFLTVYKMAQCPRKDIAYLYVAVHMQMVFFAQTLS